MDDAASGVIHERALLAREASVASVFSRPLLEKGQIHPGEGGETGVQLALQLRSGRVQLCPQKVHER